MRIAAASLNQIPLDWEGNIQRILRAITEAKRRGVDVLCLPELCLSGYGCEDLFLSPWLSEKALNLLMEEVLPHTRGIKVMVGLSIEGSSLSPPQAGKVFNTMAFMSNGMNLEFRAKQFMAIDGVHYEFRWFTPWPRGKASTLNYQGHTYPFGDILPDGLGIEICEDAWRAKDRPGYDLYEKGAKIIFNPSASHFAMGKTLEREKLMVESSRQFEALYVYVNLLGNESGRMIYDGEIMVTHKGALIAKAPLLQWEDFYMLQVDYDPLTHEVQMGEITAAATKETEFFKASTLALFDYMRKSRSKGFVVSLSGGADSATCAVLVAEMVKRGIKNLGWDEFLSKSGRKDLLNKIDKSEGWEALMPHFLTLAYQATENSGDATLHAARSLAGELNARFHTWSIQEEFETMKAKIAQAQGRKLSWEQDDIALQNIQARLRSPMVWMLANMEGKLLLTTSNRSEGDVGYTTMDGDSSGSLAPIAGVDKPFIRHVLRWAEKELDYPALRFINALDPTAELRPAGQSQSDEKDLMPYDVLLAVERKAIPERKSPMQVYKEMIQEWDLPPAVLKTYVQKFYRLWSRNQWKRERTAPSFHLDDFNIDPKTWYRFPILSAGFEEELRELEGL